MYSRSNIYLLLSGCSFKTNPPFICMQFATNVSSHFWITKEKWGHILLMKWKLGLSVKDTSSGMAVGRAAYLLSADSRRPPESRLPPLGHHKCPPSGLTLSYSRTQTWSVAHEITTTLSQFGVKMSKENLRCSLPQCYSFRRGCEPVKISKRSQDFWAMTWERGASLHWISPFFFL